MNKYYTKIINYMMNRPGELVKINNIAIDLFVPKKSVAFERAWRDLVACGRLEIIGNEVRINQ